MDLTNLYAGLTRASTYNPVNKKTLTKGLKRFNLDFSSVTGKSDSDLRKLARQTVINKYLAAKKKSPKGVITQPLTQGPRKGKSTDNF